MSRKLVLLSVGHIWRREPTRRRVVSWRVGPSSSTRKTRAPFERWRCAAVLPTCGIAQINEPRPGCLGPSGDIARDRRELTHCARVFLTRDGSTSRPLRQLTTLRVSGRRRLLGAWREASRAARRLESARHRGGKNGVKPRPARPSAARSPGPRRCPRRDSLIGAMSRIGRTAAPAKGRRAQRRFSG